MKNSNSKKKKYLRHLSIESLNKPEHLININQRNIRIERDKLKLELSNFRRKFIKQLKLNCTVTKKYKELKGLNKTLCSISVTKTHSSKMNRYQQIQFYTILRINTTKFIILTNCIVEEYPNQTTITDYMAVPPPSLINSKSISLEQKHQTQKESEVTSKYNDDQKQQDEQCFVSDQFYEYILNYKLRDLQI